MSEVKICPSCGEDVGEGAGEDDVGEAEGGGEQRGDVAVSEAGYTAADAGDVEFERRMGLGKLYKSLLLNKLLFRAGPLFLCM